VRRKNASLHQAKDEGPLLDRREFARVDLPACAFAFDANGNDLGQVVETSGGGLLLNPCSPFARISLAKGHQLILTVLEPASGNKTEMAVEVRYVRSNSIGLRFR